MSLLLRATVKYSCAAAAVIVTKQASGGGRQLMIHSFTQRRDHRCGPLKFVDDDARRSLLLVTDSTLIFGWVLPTMMMMSFTSKVECHPSVQ